MRTRSNAKRFVFSGMLGLAVAAGMGLAGCKSNPAGGPAPIVDGVATTGGDPADVNMAPVSGSAATNTGYTAPAQQQTSRVLSSSAQEQPQSSSESYDQNQAQNYSANQAYDASAYDQDAAAEAGDQALYADQAPPPLPEYQQPELTEPGYEWTPGFWNYAPAGYYWVPGAWVAPPYSGALWTPGYWGSYNHRYLWHRGFWGLHIGFYGGVPYGFGYTGEGYHGGYWRDRNFYYNTQVNRVNVSVVRNVYVHNVTIVNNTRVSFNGPGGLQVRPRPAEIAVLSERRVAPMQAQIQVVHAAEANRAQFFEANHGRPAEVVAPQRIAADRVEPRALPVHPMMPAHAGPGAAAVRPAYATPQMQQQQQQSLHQQEAHGQPALPQVQQRQQEMLQPQSPQQRPAEQQRMQQQQHALQPAPAPQRVAPPQPNVTQQEQQRQQQATQQRQQEQQQQLHQQHTVPAAPVQRPQAAPEQPRPQPAPQRAPAAPQPQAPHPAAPPAPHPQAAPHPQPAAHPEPPRSEEHPKQ